MEDNDFLGRGWGFPPTFVKGRDGIQIRMVEKEDDIRESLKILFSTQCGERLMDAEYGCYLYKLQFEGLTESIRSRIVGIISKAILLYEPRISLLNVDVTLDANRAIQGRLNISLDYIVRATNSRSNMVYPFYFLEGNNI
jgi:phage baseplate assembly protein W